VQISNKNNKVGVAEQIMALEAAYDIKLPEDYKRFLLKYNGGDTPETSIYLGKGRGLGETDVRYFYSVAESDKSFTWLDGLDLLDEYLDDSLLPIASDTFGNEFVIGVADVNRGKVYFYDHELQKTTTELASTFTDFVGMCKTEIKRGVRTFEMRAQSYREKHGKDADEALQAIWRKQVPEAIELYRDMTEVEF
jgi:hypothetical protein